ncbi:MAG: cysteine desulfurase [Propionibacteriales bacterium]|nr:cysteine desulfurase [Propionibacteriales bacterium]
MAAIASGARAYVDHAASSPMSAAVMAVMAEAMALAGNPSALHASGRQARRMVEEARESLAADVGAHPSEVIFTSGGTEANNLALLGAAAPDQKVVISAIEHPSVADVRRVREQVAVAGVDAFGRLRSAEFADLVDGAALASVMWVNNETGVVQDVAAVAARAHAAGAIAHSDAVQALGHVPVDFAASGLDLLSLSAHKLGGPVGVGALIVRRGVALRASGFGGGQEAKLRSGTVPVALVAGFAAAARAAIARRESEAARLEALRRQVAALGGVIPGAIDNSAEAHSPAIINLTFAGIRADDVLLLLDAAGIDASTGSACTAGVHQPSEVLLAMGRSREDAGASLRFSFGATTTSADIDRLVAVLPHAVETARRAAAT